MGTAPFHDAKSGRIPRPAVDECAAAPLAKQLSRDVLAARASARDAVAVREWLRQTRERNRQILLDDTERRQRLRRLRPARADADPGERLGRTGHGSCGTGTVPSSSAPPSPDP